MDQTDVGLKSVVKALSDAVAPAIDPGDPLAQEQIRLAIAYIEFVRKRLDYLHGRQRYELQHYSELARGLLEDGVSGELADRLRDELDRADVLVQDPAALTGDLRDAALELGHAVAGAVRARPELDADLAARIAQRVLDATEQKVDFERHWFAPLGFDPAPPDESGLPGFLR